MTIEDAAKEDWDLVALPGGMPGTYSRSIESRLEYWRLGIYIYNISQRFCSCF